MKKRILYVWGWQKLRVSLSFKDEASTMESIKTLELYLAESLNDGERANRLYRIVNMMAATSMGMSGRIKQARSANERAMVERMRDAVVSFREPLSEELAVKTVEHVDVDDEQRRGELKLAFVEDRATFDVVYKDLNHRFYKGKGADVRTATQIAERRANRGELDEYLDMMAGVVLEGKVL